MIEVEITGRETMILFPGQIFGVPDNIAGQLIRRGKAKEVPKKGKKVAAD